MNIFDQYGIREVTDATLFSIHRKQDGSDGVYYVPALHLDTLKISSTEKTGDNVWAEGGQGNARHISWDYGKRISVNLEDALCTPAQLGLCWGGVLSADWKDSHVQIQSSASNTRCNPVERISRLEQNYYPRNDKQKGSISNLLPRLQSDIVDEDLSLLRVSSVVDGTRVQGFGYVGNHSYKWQLAIESAVCSISQVPDRFFDVNGRSYPIDINRKVSVHSLPTYENYKDAIIYKINSRTKVVPPLAKIIFDYAMESRGHLEIVDIELVSQSKSSMNFGEIWEAAGYLIHADGILEKIDQGTSTYYYPLFSLSKVFTHTSGTFNDYNYSLEVKMYQITDEDIINGMIPETISANPLSFTKVNYHENHAMTDLCGVSGQINLDHEGSVEEVIAVKDICEADYLAIIVDNHNEYHALIGVYSEKDQNEPRDLVIWYKPSVPVDVSQFKGLDMWLRFSGVNEMIYFLITKYENDILTIDPSTVNANEGNGTWAVDDKVTTVDSNEEESLKGRLWAYVNPKTMRPYEDDYWFHQGEGYLVKSLTLAESKRLKANRIVVSDKQWPGMYMFVGETWIRNHEGNDEHLQIKIPFCKLRSDNTITLEAGGDPVVFNLNLDVGSPRNGELIEITTYETSARAIKGENGCYYTIDGSTQVLSE